MSADCAPDDALNLGDDCHRIAEIQSHLLPRRLRAWDAVQWQTTFEVLMPVAGHVSPLSVSLEIPARHDQALRRRGLGFVSRAAIQFLTLSTR
jgi:hypothetical protein